MRRVHVSLSFLLRLIALPDTSCMGWYNHTGVPWIIQSGREGQTGFCYVLACIEQKQVLIYVQKDINQVIGYFFIHKTMST
jgi:hypothetical protein